MTDKPLCNVWEENVVIPTYCAGNPDKNPMFLENRVYQGSSGVVYPYPVIERVYNEKHDQPYRAVFLENDYIKIMVLPELGGRVQMALDKTNGYHFIYYNRVIKPALVGLAGPWISGGIEFNWPQHHRPSTFEPVEWRIVKNDDESQTLWCSEYERMFFTKGLHGFTIYPNRAYLEIQVQLFNRSSVPQTFLWWANPAVHVNDDYQSIFPPDVHAVMDHGKRDVSAFPIAKGTYYKVNYAPGTDISRYRNIPVPTSYMAYHSDYDFVGDYDHGKQAGMMHVANHHIVPGKKQWTWGNSEFGKAWDRHLTDEDGPYIELMCGAFTDNQPDFSWLMPGEEKQFTQIFMPYKGIGGAKNANKDVVVNFDVENGVAKVGVYLTQPRHVNVCLESRTFADESHIALYTTIFAENVSLSPAQAYVRNIGVSDMDLSAFRLRVSENGRNLIEYVSTSKTVDDIPSPASPAKSPSELTSNEELFINGLHLEQYRHANTASEPYYLEALKRDPLDSRCNNALGLLHFRRGRFATAEAYFRNAIISLTRRNPNPYDGEAYYNLGLCLKMLQRPSEAFDALYKAVWNAAWQASAYYELACLANRHFADPAQALELTQQALRRNVSHHKARHLQIALLRHDGRLNEAQKALDAALELDPMEMGALREKQYLNENKSSEFTAIARGNANLYLEIALDYANAGLFDSAIELLNEAIALPETRLKNALLSYHIAHFFLQKGQMSNAKVQYEKASQQPSDYCFPHHLESVLALQSAIELNPADARAPYYLGNFWYAHRQYELAISNWEHARDLDPKFATVWRNLGLAYCNKLQDLSQAQIAYQTAFALNLNDSRVLFELDQLEKKCNCSQTDRLARLEQYSQLVDERDDLSIERITMLSTLGYFDKAYDLIMARQFHPWEGGEGKVTSQFVLCLVERAKQLIKNGAFDVAIAQLHLALTRPHNLGEGRLPNAQENNIYYHLGVAYDQNGNKKLAQECYVKAAQGMSEPSSAMFYNDQPPDMIYFQGLARQKLGNETEARLIFNTLVEYGLKHLDDEVKLDYFAVSYPTFGVFDDDLNLRNRVHCHYMLCLGYKGLGDVMTAQSHFDHILKLDNSHQGGLVIKD